MVSMDCSVRIVTASAEGERVFSADGHFSRHGDTFFLRYPDEGDAVQIAYSADFFEMDRRGKADLSAKFCTGKTTVFRIFSAGGVGAVPVSTDILQVSEDGLEVRLAYCLHFSGGDERFSLKILISERESIKK